MIKLRKNRLVVKPDGILHPSTPTAQEAAKKQQAAARQAPLVREPELNAEVLFQRLNNAIDLKGDTQAVKWFSEAATSGNANGMAGLGVMHSNGWGGLPKDDTQAVSWFRKAAELGAPRGMSGLGLMYSTGRGGLPKDDMQAVRWFQKAADAGSTTGMSNLELDGARNEAEVKYLRSNRR